MRGLLPVAGLALLAYVVGRQTSAVTGSPRLADLEHRLAELENEPHAAVSGPRTDKEYTAFHYEALANQAAQERRMDELDVRLTEVELRRHASRATRCGHRQDATTGESRHG